MNKTRVILGVPYPITAEVAAEMSQHIEERWPDLDVCVVAGSTSVVLPPAPVQEVSP